MDCQGPVTRRKTSTRLLFIPVGQEVPVERGDILTIAAAIVIVIVIAVIANPRYLPATAPPVSPTPEPMTIAVTSTVPHQEVEPGTPATSPPAPTVVQNHPVPAPQRILYSDSPLSYPVFTLPTDLETFGASDIPLRHDELVTFAVINETRGGLTQVFTVPYPVWIINSTVISRINPQYGNFRMVLAYASNGTVITGQEILNRGSEFRTVEVSGVPMYMIVSTASIDGYEMDLQTTRDYYDQYTPR